jgi:hypothetical protein
MSINDCWIQASTALPIRLVSTAHSVSIVENITDHVSRFVMFAFLSSISLSSFACLERFIRTERLSSMDSVNTIINTGALSVPHNGLNPPI